MYAEVIPLTRLPAHLHRFDYQIPSSAGALKCGVLVTVPWRNGTMFGIIARLKKTSDVKKCKPIREVVHPLPLVPATLLSIWEKMARLYHVSEATIAKTTVPGFPKSTLSALTLTPLKSAHTTRAPAPVYHNYASPLQRARTLLALVQKSGVHLYLSDERHDAEDIATLLQQEHIPHLLYHSELTQKEKYERWLTVRNAKPAAGPFVVVGTKSALFLPFPFLTSIIFDREASPHHKNWDAQPLYHARDVAEMLSHYCNAPLQLLSFIPSLTTFHAMQEKKIKKADDSAIVSTKNTVIIPMEPHRRSGSISLFADKTLAFIEAHARESLFFFINRKGYAHAMRCRECGRVERCPACGAALVYYKKEMTLRCHVCSHAHTPPLECVQCGGVRFSLFGCGTEHVAEELSEIAKKLPVPVPVVRLDRALTQPKNGLTPGWAWYVGTEFALSRLPWQIIKGVVVVDADQLLSMPTFMAAERTFDLIMELLYHLRPSSGTLLIQTDSPDYPLFEALKKNAHAHFFEQELGTRAQFNYPPYCYLVRLIFDATKQSHVDMLRSTITGHSLHARSEGPYPFKKNKEMLLVRFEPGVVESELPMLTRTLPPDWKVDPNPITLLE